MKTKIIQKKSLEATEKLKYKLHRVDSITKNQKSKKSRCLSQSTLSKPNLKKRKEKKWINR